MWCRHTSQTRSRRLGTVLRVSLATLSVATVVAACGGGVGPDADGATIYESVCARCHGADLGGGIGPPLAGPDAPSLGLPESYFLQTVSRGKGRMPSFGGTLSDDQIQRVVDFILEQQGR